MAAEQDQTVDQRGFLRLAWGVVRRPGGTFEYLRQHKSRSWLLLALIGMLMAVAVIVVSAPISARLAQEQIRAQFEERGTNLADVPPEVQQQAAQIATNPLFNVVLPGVLRIAGMWILWLVWAGALHLLGTMVGGSSSFGQMWRAVVWSWLPQTLRSILQTIFVLASGSVIQNQGLSGLVPQPDPQAGALARLSTGQLAIRSFLGQIDLFQVWSLVLLVVAVVVTARLSRRKALLITLGVWLLLLLIGLLPALVAGSLAGGLSNID